MKAIVDRIEENIIVIEYEDKMYDVDIKYCNGEVNEGDCVDIEFDDDKIISVKKNDEDTKSRKEYIADITKDMWQ